MSKESFSLDHLTETQFEEFCFDLLHERGFINIKWRKGTGLSASPSDRGRDIECQREHTDVDGHKYLETWFVECKHYVKGVPPDKIQGALAWAAAERPDKLLLIASNFFSNPAHDYLKNYERNNRPSFKIKKWERPELERLAAGNIKLLRKYELSGDLPFLSIMHPAHLLYISGLRFNTFDYFFSVLDKLDAKKRDSLLDWAYHFIIQPRYRKPVTGKEKYIDLRVDEVSYDAFKRKCVELTTHVEESFLVSAVVNLTLQAYFGIGNTTSIDTKLDDFNKQLHLIETLRKTHKGESDEQVDMLNFIIDSLKKAERDFREERVTEFFDSIEKQLKRLIPEYPSNIKKNYDLYVYFCEHVIKDLLVEKEIL